MAWRYGNVVEGWGEGVFVKKGRWAWIWMGKTDTDMAKFREREQQQPAKREISTNERGELPNRSLNTRENVGFRDALTLSRRLKRETEGDGLPDIVLGRTEGIESGSERGRRDESYQVRLKGGMFGDEGGEDGEQGRGREQGCE